MDLNKIIAILAVILIALIVTGAVMFNPIQSKTDSMIGVTSSSEMSIGDTFSIKLTNEHNTPIANQTVNVSIGENNYRITTDSNGDASFQLTNLSAGNYDVKINYGGNEAFNPSNTTQKIVIKEVQKESSSPKEYYDSQGHQIVFDNDNTLHVVDSNGNTIPGSGSNYYMDGDQVVMTGKG